MGSFLHEYGLLLALGAAIWVFFDARKRGKGYPGAILWCLATFLVLIVAVPLWLFYRPALPPPPPPAE